MTSILIVSCAVSSLLAVVPMLLFFANRRLYRVSVLPLTSAGQSRPAISVLIPARNESAGIAACVDAALASTHVDVEVVVLDDHSEDDTMQIVSRIASVDRRVRIEPAPPLSDGWCGKQHACYVLSSLARYPTLAFIDADVRLEPEGLARAIAFQRSSGASLVSGIPRQITGSFLEHLLIALIHFLLLSYLPLDRMRRSTMPAYGAGCGQFFLTDRNSYNVAGGHAAIRNSLHDGIALPRAYRQAGLKTDLFDATPVASCRMYHSAAEVWNGLAKNATEGMAAPKMIVPWTVLLVGGHVMPILLLAVLPFLKLNGFALTACAALCLLSVASAYAVRFTAALQFRQSLLSAAMHPLGIFILVAIQWFAVLRQLRGKPASWRGRTYGGASAAAADVRTERPAGLT